MLSSAQTIKSLDLLLAHCVNHAYHYPTTTQSQGLEQIQSSRRITQPKKQARIGRDLLTAHKYLCAEAPHAQNLRGQTHQPPTSHHHRDDLHCCPVAEPAFKPGVSPDQIFQHVIRYNPIHNTVSTKYAYKHKLTKTTVHIAQIFLETCIHYNK